ncbi:MAG TPA: type II toxin-antitoxin system ParD family antitoxin [Azospirillaceae bacterium]|nr:type II toxin-antitoxin system ParD family antitoxin [Azospirillaceae bacterium]
MPTRNVVLTDHQEALIAELVASGRYQNASEVLREGIRLIEMRERAFEAKLKRLHEAAEVGIRDIEEGRYEVVPLDQLDTYFEKLMERVLDRSQPLADSVVETPAENTDR